MKQNTSPAVKTKVACASLFLLFHAAAVATSSNICAAKLVNPISLQTNSDTPETDGGALGISFFNGSWQQALNTAAKLQRPVFVLLGNYSVTEYRQLELSVFNHEETELFFNSHFFNCKLNPAYADGEQLISKYHIVQMPVCLFFSPTGELLLQESCPINKDKLLAAGKTALDIFRQKPNDAFMVPVSSQPSGKEVKREYIQLLEYQIKYKNGFRSSEFLYEYAYLLKKFNEPVQTVVNQFLSGIAITDLSLPRNVQFIYDFADDIQSSAFSLLVSNRFYYSSILDKQKTEQRIAEALKSAVFNAAVNNNNAQFNAVLSVMKKCRLANEQETELYLRALFFEKTNNWSDYSGLMIGQYRNGENINPDLLDEAAWKFAVHVNNEPKLEKALLWTEQNMNQYPVNFKYRETYAALLYRLNQPKKALKEAERAKEIARKKGQYYFSTLNLTDLIQKGLPLTEDIRE